MTLELIRAVEDASSADSLLDAVTALAEAESPEAIPTLITVLGYNNPGAAVAAVDGLIKLGEIAVEPLLTQLDGYNYGARAWAVRALAGIGDPRGLNILLEAASSDFALSVRRAAARGLGIIQWEKMSAEQISKAQLKAYHVLKQASADPEWIVRYAAVVGLEGLAAVTQNQHPEWLDDLFNRLEEMINSDDSLAVCTRARLAKQQLQLGNKD